VNSLVKLLARSPLLTPDLDHYLVRAALVIIFVLFGYQKWFDYEARVLIPYISHGPLVFWLYPVFGILGQVTKWQGPARARRRSSPP
jgi:uncharacterized membrane protein YkgB